MTGRFEGERAVVVGAGVAGLAAARVLAEEGATVIVTERRDPSDLGAASAELTRIGAELRAGGHREDDLADATLVVTGPGVPEAAPVLAWARDRGIPVWGEMELGARLCDVPYVAVTGTNGKSTATGMIAACLRAAGMDAVGCGNIGHPFPLAAREGHDALVVECSSFQLQIQESLHPAVSVLLNLAPDHLDWHGSYAAYVAAKGKVYARQGPGDVHVGNRDDPEAEAVSSSAPCDVVWFREGPPAQGEVGYEDAELVARVGDAARLGVVDGARAGYRADAAAAAAAALSFGADAGSVRRGLAGYEPLRHRGELVALRDGVRFIDNSKATNVHAALAAIDLVRDAVLIAGGRAKGADLEPLASRADRLRAVVAIGESAPEIAEVFDGIRPVTTAASIEEAVSEAFAIARPGGVVLLAPAGASWDQFADYAERGDRFAAAARALTEVTAHG